MVVDYQAQVFSSGVNTLSTLDYVWSDFSAFSAFPYIYLKLTKQSPLLYI